MKDVDVDVVALSDHRAIKFSIHVSGKLPLKSKRLTFDFKRGEQLKGH